MADWSASPTELVDDVERRLRSHEDPVALVAEFARAPKFRVQSAYAVARQSHRERAADVLELALLERQRGGATAGHRWYHRAEGLLALQSVFLLNPIVQVALDPDPLRIGFLVVVLAVVLAGGVVFARAMRDPSRMVPEVPGSAEGTVPRRALALANAALGDLPDDEAAATARLRDLAGDRDEGTSGLARFQAAAALAAAEKAAGGALVGRRGRALKALDAARRAVLADLDAGTEGATAGAGRPGSSSTPPRGPAG